MRYPIEQLVALRVVATTRHTIAGEVVTVEEWRAPGLVLFEASVAAGTLAAKPTLADTLEYAERFLEAA